LVDDSSRKAEQNSNIIVENGVPSGESERRNGVHKESDFGSRAQLIHNDKDDNNKIVNENESAKEAALTNVAEMYKNGITGTMEIDTEDEKPQSEQQKPEQSEKHSEQQHQAEQHHQSQQMEQPMDEENLKRIDKEKFYNEYFAPTTFYKVLELRFFSNVCLQSRIVSFCQTSTDYTRSIVVHSPCFCLATCIISTNHGKKHAQQGQHSSPKFFGLHFHQPFILTFPTLQAVLLLWARSLRSSSQPSASPQVTAHFPRLSHCMDVLLTSWPLK
jgi:hypothetical protein